MSSRFPLVAFSLLAALPALGRAEPVPSTTDEARALAGRTMPRPQPASVRTIRAVGSTDEARAVAGGLLVVAPAARREQVASCGKSCDCGHRG